VGPSVCRTCIRTLGICCMREGATYAEVDETVLEGLEKLGVHTKGRHTISPAAPGPPTLSSGSQLPPRSPMASEQRGSSIEEDAATGVEGVAREQSALHLNCQHSKYRSARL
jgi:hypothetical protein